MANFQSCSSPGTSMSGGFRRTRPLGVFSPRRMMRMDLETSKVRVVVRIRPFIASEIDAAKGDPKSCLSIVKGDASALELEDTLKILDSRTGRTEGYKLDSCYGQEDNIGNIFSKEVSTILPGLFRGSNATVFAYGATGSGKTYTMQGTHERPGLMVLAINKILSMAENSKSTIKVSYYEVYLDRCYDLLQSKNKEVPIMEDAEGRVQLRGLSEVPVSSLEEFQKVFENGCNRRKVGHTGLNDVSSRSHGVLMISVISDDGIPDMPLVGKLNLIDLAGNEDNRRTGNEGIRLNESVSINQSLFALSNVIHALNANESRVPYRDSKLTRILQDSLGGTSRALMIACLNPISCQEAFHTVSLAARSRQIVNHVNPENKQDNTKAKVDMNAKLNAWLESKGKRDTKSAKTNTVVSGRLFTPCKQTPNRLFGGPRGFSPKAGKLLGPPLRVKVNHTEETPKPSFSEVMTTKESTKENGANDAVNYSEDDKYDSQTEVGNDFQNILHVTNEYCDDKENKSFKIANIDRSSPPLSERLKQLHSKFEEMLRPKNSAANITSAVNHITVWSLAKEPTNTITNDSSLSKETIGNITVDDPLVKEPLDQPLIVKEPLNESITVKEQLNPNLGCGEHYEAISPKTPHLLNKEAEAKFGFIEAKQSQSATPLERFSARSSGLKMYLTQEYLNFLNTASREELLSLKGIGEKRANYILELRVESPEPFKEPEDLEKIGLSKKQAYTLLRSAARNMF